jgi:hypothetical protein
MDGSSSVGITEIPVSIVKYSKVFFSQHLAELFNYCIVDNCIPDDWKVAVVTPLYKNKGS